jgi:TonB family protein
VAFGRESYFIVASAFLASCLSRQEVIQPSNATESSAPAEPSDAPIAPSNAGTPESADANGPSAASTSMTASDGGVADGGVPSRGLSQEQVRSVVLTNVEPFQRCYEVALAKDLDLQGGVTITFAIAPDGTVKSADVTLSSLGNPLVESCMVKVFRELRFPMAEQQTNGVFPFAFKKKL